MVTLKKIILSVIVSVSLANFIQAQKSWKESQESYINYFNLNRETLFLHLNKTTVAPGENIWLSAYVYDTRMNLPNKESVIVNLGIYDEKGTHLETKTIFISYGKGSTFIPLNPEKFIPGNYFLKASTNYMQNFEEDLSYTQTFKVLGKQNPVEITKEGFDLQLLPEGGHLLSKVVNSVGVKLLNKLGEGVAFDDAVLLDDKKNQITTFNSNKFGISRFFFTPEPDEEYTLRLLTNQGEEIEKNIGKAAQTGISLVSTARDDHFLFSIRTNSETRETIKDEEFLIAFHKDGKIRTLNFNFPTGELEANIIISKDSLFPGVNTITVFDEKLHPRLERLIFNEKR